MINHALKAKKILNTKLYHNNLIIVASLVLCFYGELLKLFSRYCRNAVVILRAIH